MPDAWGADAQGTGLRALWERDLAPGSARALCPCQLPDVSGHPLGMWVMELSCPHTMRAPQCCRRDLFPGVPTLQAAPPASPKLQPGFGVQKKFCTMASDLLLQEQTSSGVGPASGAKLRFPS